MENGVCVRLSDLFSPTSVNKHLHGYSGFAKSELPFKTYNSNLIWNRDKSISTFLAPGTENSQEHECCALETTRQATTTEIIEELGGMEIVSKHLYGYGSVENLVSRAPSYRRCFGDNYHVIKEEMNLFFTLGKNSKLCCVGVYFGPYPLHQYSVFANEALPAKESKIKKNFFQRIFSPSKSSSNETIWPIGTRVFLIGEPKDVLISYDLSLLTVA